MRWRKAAAWGAIAILGVLCGCILVERVIRQDAVRLLRNQLNESHIIGDYSPPHPDRLTLTQVRIGWQHLIRVSYDGTCHGDGPPLDVAITWNSRPWRTMDDDGWRFGPP